VAVAVAGLWELGYNAPFTEAHLWEHPVRDFAIDEWHMSPVTGIANASLVEWQSSTEMFDSLRQRYRLVFVTEAVEYSPHVPCELEKFTHPETCCYVFGRTNWSPFLSHAIRDDDVVCMSTATGLGLSMAANVLFTVLWHRRLQWQ
jgi:hypothetical protein